MITPIGSPCVSPRLEVHGNQQGGAQIVADRKHVTALPIKANQSLLPEGARATCLGNNKGYRCSNNIYHWCLMYSGEAQKLSLVFSRIVNVCLGVRTYTSCISCYI